eukprot:TRINITY_DN29695_c0_g1_i3.p1 TRINITY_DN29695_c0_g1~~TRINITY_DN29695_c0_g1_i3.p1  ORF type:complete len:576 (-),score=130.22 TRINITY_DN29695_c0_g1_i3:63-1790(-)
MSTVEASDGSGLLLSSVLEKEGHREALIDAVEKADFNSPFGAQLRELLLKGVGVHHAGLLPRYRRLVEQLAQSSLLALVCGTDTLGVGINVPIRSVLFTKLCRFNGDDTELLPSRDFHQISGRAGRKGFDTTGDVVAVDPNWVVQNRELQDRVKSKKTSELPRWKRPPRRNYVHWSEKTFQKLQKSSPEPLSSQFRLSMAQVLAVIEGARQKGRDGKAELWNLINSAQCSRSQQRFWHRQADTFLNALQRSGFALDTDGTSAEDDGASEASSTESGKAFSGPLLPVDDVTLFIFEAIAILKQRVAEEDYPFAVLVAAESMCDMPTSLQRAVETAQSSAKPGELLPGSCPAGLEDLLFEIFTDFQQRHPWVAPGMLRPKGIALEIVARNLSFAELAVRLGGSEGPAVTSEGGLLRYLADVYRTLRLSTAPCRAEDSNLRLVEGKLRQAVLDVDSSLIREWEVLREIEEQADSGASVVMDSDKNSGSSAALSVLANEEKLVGGAMVPASTSSRQQRTREELAKRVQDLTAELDLRHCHEEAVRAKSQRSLLGRTKRWARHAWDAANDLFGSLMGAVW